MLNIADTDDTSGAAFMWEFVNCLKNGGSGSWKANAFVPNPSPYDKTKIDLLDSSPNALNFHATKYGGYRPSPCMGGTPRQMLLFKMPCTIASGRGRQRSISKNN